MLPWISRSLPKADLELLKAIKLVVLEMPEVSGLETNDFVSCHMLAHALARHFPVRVADGYFQKGFRHSWLVTKSGSLIDPYPPYMVGAPILIQRGGEGGNPLDPWEGLYRESEFRSLDTVQFRNDIKKVSLSISETLEKVRGRL